MGAALGGGLGRREARGGLAALLGRGGGWEEAEGLGGGFSEGTEAVRDALGQGETGDPVLLLLTSVDRLRTSW